ncbi:hypothetical protein AB0P37_07270 [Streptomyces antimycoticus]|uniref:hypothetical protein n=1 Tax=Streptomyces antimycoticus TaxID=68175 RepID=UPI0034155EAB
MHEMLRCAPTRGADVHRLSTLWELAERAWSRSEMRHDVTMEAISVARARAATEQFDPAARGMGARKNGRPSKKSRPSVELPVPDQPLVAMAPVFSAPATSAERAPGSFRTPAPALSPPPPPSPSPSPSGTARKRVALFAGGLVGALLLVAGAVLLIDAGGDGEKRGERPTTHRPPARVSCRRA